MKENYLVFLTVLVLVTGLAGCASAGMPFTSDPAKKLRYAENLYTNQNRPLPAESLIEEAYDACKKKYAEDKTCLAAVYITYAGFLQSNAVKDWIEGYRKDGFWDKSVTVENRYEKAVEYWERALNIFERNNMHAEASNAYFNIGKIYHAIFRNEEMACESYNKSLQSHLFFRKDNPHESVELPSGFGTYTQVIDYMKDKSGCK